MAEYRYFKCNVLGGFRLSDLNKNIKQGEYLQLESQMADASRAVIAAIRSKWMVEVGEKEAAKSLRLDAPRVEAPKRPSNESVAKNGVAIHDASETNKPIEVRQARKGRKKTEAERAQSTVSIPDFPKVAADMKARRDDTIDRKDRVLESPVKKAEKTVELVKDDEDEEFETLRAAIEGPEEDSDTEALEEEPEVLEPAAEVSVKDGIKAEVAKRATFRRKTE